MNKHTRRKEQLERLARKENLSTLQIEHARGTVTWLGYQYAAGRDALIDDIGVEEYKFFLNHLERILEYKGLPVHAITYGEGTYLIDIEFARK